MFSMFGFHLNFDRWSWSGGNSRQKVEELINTRFWVFEIQQFVLDYEINFEPRGIKEFRFFLLRATSIIINNSLISLLTPRYLFSNATDIYFLKIIGRYKLSCCFEIKWRCCCEGIRSEFFRRNFDGKLIEISKNFE